MKLTVLRFTLIIIVLLALIGLFSLFRGINSYKAHGTLKLEGLSEPVTVVRDEKGMPYIFARNRSDLLMAQGFVTAQDRLFPMEIVRLYARGNIALLAGKAAKPVDVRMKTLGLYRLARKHAAILNETERNAMQRYVDGVNAYIRGHSETHPLEFKLSGLKVAPWSIEDSLSIMYYMGWSTSANASTEVIAQMLIEKLGLEKAREIFPLTINPDDDSPAVAETGSRVQAFAGLGLMKDPTIQHYLEPDPLAVGSNNWVVGPRHSPNGKPVVANDPHLSANVLPGPWHAVGLISPELRAVGLMIPGLPGIVIGRTDHAAFGITNAYGDIQDLYVETVDPENPDHYLEGAQSIPFEVIEEEWLFKDKDAPEGIGRETVRIRLTRRGPVVSGVLRGLSTDRVLTLRWSPAETMGPSLGVTDLLAAGDTDEIRQALSRVTNFALNFVFADTKGNIGWQTTGRLPIRSRGDGTVPVEVTDGRDNWQSFIPFDEMPQSDNPDRGWTGTCNHTTVKKDYPYYYGSYMSPSFRYQRLKELLNQPGVKTADDHWQFQRDTLNIMARNLTPLMAAALSQNSEFAGLAEILKNWDFRDDPEKAAPAVFQSVYRHYARQVFEDELGEALTVKMLKSWYFWQERLHAMTLDGASVWFDDVTTTDRTETRDDIFLRAAKRASAELKAKLGDDPKKWKWGDLHRMEFVSPIRRSGTGKRLLGAGSHPAPGSGEVLYRGIYRFDRPYDVSTSASARMVADLGDPEKVLAVLPGGITGRVFHPHTTDQVTPFMNGEKRYWWFSDAAIEAHRESKLVLRPD